MKTFLDDPARLLEIGKTLQHAGRVLDAIDVLSEGLRLSPSDPAIRFQRALCLLQCGFFSQGWTDYELRLHDHPLAKHLGRPLRPGRHVILHGEQGIGDEIMFASCVPDLLGDAGRFTWITDSRLQNLFRHSFPLAEVSDKDARQSTELTLDDRDSLVMCGSLGGFYRQDTRLFPGTKYLHPDEIRREFFRSILSPTKLNVGLAWRGGIVETRRQIRSLSFPELAPVMENATFPMHQHASFYALQHGIFPGECVFAEMSGAITNISSGLFDDWLELASFISALDLVITVQSSIVHLCGALGVPCWAMISAAPEWRYGIQGDAMPWYRSVKLYRQGRLGDWSGVLNRVRNDLTRKVEGRKS